MRIILGAIALSFSLQLHATAQTTLQESANIHQTIYQPDLHARQPTPLNTSEQDIRLVLKLKQRKLYVYQSGSLRVSYPVAIGKAGWETPTGNFKVIGMLKNPGWTNFKTGERVSLDPNNPLGERWIGFWTDGKDDIGFHGTPKRWSVGLAVSHGCVRMYNEHIRELYNLVTVGTPVIVEP